MSPGEPKEESTSERLIDGRYRVVRKLGSGGMGVVLEAIDQHLDRSVAIKQIHKEEIGIDLVARLEREARSAARLGHPNIVPVFDFGDTGPDAPYLVMQLLEGEPLEDVLAAGAMSMRRAVDVHTQILDGLAAAHKAQVIHRDLKPANIYLTPLGPGRELVRILDFGLAYLLEEGAKKLTATGITLGTPAYMPPERILGETADARSDVYAVGICLYEALAGFPPFEGDPREMHGRVLTEAAPDIRDQRPAVPEALAEVIAKSLRKRPDERWQSSEAMREALSRVPAEALHEDGAPVLTRSPGPRPSAAPRVEEPPEDEAEKSDDDVSTAGWFESGDSPLEAATVAPGRLAAKSGSAANVAPPSGAQAARSGPEEIDRSGPRRREAVGLPIPVPATPVSAASAAPQPAPVLWPWLIVAFGLMVVGAAVTLFARDAGVEPERPVNVVEPEPMPRSRTDEAEIPEGVTGFGGETGAAGTLLEEPVEEAAVEGAVVVEEPVVVETSEPVADPLPAADTAQARRARRVAANAAALAEAGMAAGMAASTSAAEVTMDAPAMDSVTMSADEPASTEATPMRRRHAPGILEPEW